MFALLFGENGDSGELHLKDSETFKDPFENDQLDVFTFNDLLSLGQLIKIRVWHDNKGESYHYQGAPRTLLEPGGATYS